MTAENSKEAYDIGLDAYTYFYPLVTMDLTRRQTTNVEAGKFPGRGPMNVFNHIRAYPTADFRAVVRPNFDTLYSSAWLDLTNGPVIVSAADTNGRYYMLPMLDMWTDVFASPGKRTTGTGAGQFAVVPPGWSGQLPEGVERIDSPTPYVWLIGRTQTNGPNDYEAVHKVQDGYTVTPLSQWGKQLQPAQAKIDPSVDMNTEPLKQVNSMPGLDFFRYSAELLKVNPPHITDQPILARMRRIGIEAGKSFEPGRLAPEVQNALQQAATDGLKRMRENLPKMGEHANGWEVNRAFMGVYGSYYLQRAIVAMVGLGANLPEDAIYPINLADADGKPMNGDNNYVLHFNKQDLPPVDAFWSVTMYDQEGFQAANSINRFAISSWMPLKYNADGSLDLYIQHENPGPEKEVNWLPAPNGPLGITMRLYAPKAQALEGTWQPPPIRRVEAGATAHAR
jgi:hypothetical protein